MGCGCGSNKKSTKTEPKVVERKTNLARLKETIKNVWDNTQQPTHVVKRINKKI
jgi:hypothetical protein